MSKQEGLPRCPWDYHCLLKAGWCRFGEREITSALAVPDSLAQTGAVDIGPQWPTGF